MERIYEIIQMMFLCGTILMVTFGILVSLPKSKLREFLMPIVGWSFAVFCAFYALNPFDFIPEGLLGPFGIIDDIGAIVAGIAAAKAAMTPQKD